MARPPWRCADDGIEIAVRLTPRARSEGIGGTVIDDAGRAWLLVRVAPPAADGKANAALVRLLAKRLGVAPSAVSLRAGAGQRLKRVHVAGAPVALSQRAAALSGRDG